MSENIKQSAETEGYSMNVKPQKKRSTGKIVAIVIAAIAVVAVALTLFVNSATKAPVAVSNQFLNAIQASNAATAYSLFSTPAKATVPSDQFDALVQQIGPVLNASEKMASKKVNASTGSASTAEVIYKIPGTDGKTYTFTVNLTKEGEAWKVLNFESTSK